METVLICATRPSALARWQTAHVIQALCAQQDALICIEQIITTQGDRDLNTALPEIGGKGLFTYELEQALRAGQVHLAVHSLKDLPTAAVPGLQIAAVLERADPRDVLICPRGWALQDLPPGAVVGTSSNRRSAQLLAYRPDLRVLPIRGNVETRIHKARAGQYDAIVLAAAGVLRLGLQHHITQYLPFDIVLPAPGQGALAVQCRADDVPTQQRLQAIDHRPTRLAVSAERAFLAALGGGCSLPVAALATLQGTEITLRTLIAAADGRPVIALSASGSDPLLLGQGLAQQAFALGARAYLPLDSAEKNR